MRKEGVEYQDNSNDLNAKIRDLEEKQRISKDRLLLLGENLIDLKEETTEKITEIKKSLEIFKTNMEKTIKFLETASSEFQKFARKKDLELLKKQAKMFEPIKKTKKKG
jgi:septation ring formation regulator EzrA